MSASATSAEPSGALRSREDALELSSQTPVPAATTTPAAAQKPTEMKLAQVDTKKIKNAQGIVKSTSADGLVVSGQGAEWAFAVDSRTAIRKYGKAINAADLKPGDQVNVRYMEQAGKATAMVILVKDSATPEQRVEEQRQREVAQSPAVAAQKEVAQGPKQEGSGEAEDRRLSTDDAPDPTTKVQFVLGRLGSSSSCGVIGRIPDGFDFLNEERVKAVLGSGRDYGLEKCPKEAKASSLGMELGVALSFPPSDQERSGRAAASGYFYRRDGYQTLERYDNWVARQREQKDVEAARKDAEAARGRARVPISRTIEGFSLGMTREQALANLRAGWSRQYTACTDDAVCAYKGAGANVQHNRFGNQPIEVLEFRTATTPRMTLFFHEGKLLQIHLTLLGHTPIDHGKDEVYEALSAKYGTPCFNDYKNPMGSGPPCASRVQLFGQSPGSTYLWHDSATQLTLGLGLGFGGPSRVMAYTDRGLISERLSAGEREQERQRLEAEEKAKRERKTLPRGY